MSIMESADGEEIAIPLARERAVVSRRCVERERVSVSTHITAHDERAFADLVEESIEVERIPVGREVDAPPPIRHDGDLLVVPVVREVLVKRLVLVEEVRLRRVRHTKRYDHPVTLRSMDAVIERENLDQEKDR